MKHCSLQIYCGITAEFSLLFALRPHLKWEILKMGKVGIEPTNLTETRIAGYCASSTEYSDHNLKKLQQSFSKLLVNRQPYRNKQNEK